MQQRAPRRPFVVVLTGGPCAGKTSLLARLQQQDRIAGMRLLFVPEAATLLVQRGLVIGQDVRHFQTETMRLQLLLEGKALLEAATLDEPCVIICDRGVLDGAGYCPPPMFREIVKGLGQDLASLVQRYDLVVHLVSAAVEAPAAYTVGNNDARHESLEQAVEQERLTVAAWEEHPNRVIVSSAQGFQAKLDSAVDCISRSLEALLR